MCPTLTFAASVVFLVAPSLWYAVCDAGRVICRWLLITFSRMIVCLFLGGSGVLVILIGLPKY